MMIDLHRRLDHALVDVGVSGVLHVPDAHRQRQTRRIALRLRGDIEVHRALQPFARAGNLGDRRRRGEQRASKQNPDKGNACHRSPPVAGGKWTGSDASRPDMNITIAGIG
jgi:hypothetical protein